MVISSFRIADFGFRISDFGFWISDFGFWMRELFDISIRNPHSKIRN